MARRVFITVAEVSGDKHAAQLVSALRRLEPDLIIEGIGGPDMARAGASIFHETVENAAMGWRGALRAVEVAKILRWAHRRFADPAHRPDLWIGVDSPSMNFHFARAAHEHGIPTLQYVAPQLWAWRERRMKKLRRWVDHVACILPFEEKYFRRHGVMASFVGHPLFDELPSSRAVVNPIPYPQRPAVVGLLPGSRKGEAQGNFPRMLEVARQILHVMPNVTFLIPTTAATEPIVTRLLRDSQAGRAVGRAATSRLDAFDELVPQCDLCLVVSGTATLHVAGFGVPMIVVYQGSGLLWNLLGRWLVRTRTYALVNLLADPNPTDPDPARKIVREFIPWYGSTRPVAKLMIEYLKNPTVLQQQRNTLNRLIGTLDKPGASDNVARLALQLAHGAPADHDAAKAAATH